MDKDKNEVVSGNTSDKMEKAAKWVTVAGLVVSAAEAIIAVIKASKE